MSAVESRVQSSAWAETSRDTLPRSLAALGFQIADDKDLVAAREVASRRISEGVASLDAFHAMRDLHPLSTMVFKENGVVTGVLGALPLRVAGLLAIATDKFDAVDPAPELIAPWGETPLAVYGWGFAADTRKAAAAVLSGAALFRTDLYREIPGFARASTADGRRVLCGRLGYAPFPRSTTGLLWTPPVTVANASDPTEPPR